MNTLIVFDLLESQIFCSIPQTVYKKYEEKLARCHMQFANVAGAPPECYWLSAALATEDLEGFRNEFEDAGCLGQYVIPQQEGFPFEGPFECVIFSGFLL